MIRTKLTMAGCLIVYRYYGFTELDYHEAIALQRISIHHSCRTSLPLLRTFTQDKEELV
jgi:hypothetical protein